MSCVIDMEPAITLANLPSNIIRRIVGMEPNPCLNLISPAWNDICSLPQRLGPIERVYLCTGLASGPTFRSGIENGDSGMRKEEMKQLHMHSIIPEKYAQVLGVGEWLDFYCVHGDGKIEVTCEPRTIVPDFNEILNEFGRKQAIGMGLVLSAFGSATLPLPIPISLALSFSLILTGVFYFFFLGSGCFHREARMKENLARARIARLFGKFTKNNNLVLHNFSKNIDTLDDVRKILGEVMIDRLEVLEYDLTEEHQNRIMDLCRNHAISHVHISVRQLSVRKINAFIIKLTRMGVTVDIFDISGFNSFEHQSLDKSLWQELQRDLRAQQVTMTVKSMDDPSFNRLDYDEGVKLHIRCKKTGNQDDFSPLRSRGFTFNWN